MGRLVMSSGFLPRPSSPPASVFQSVDITALFLCQPLSYRPPGACDGGALPPCPRKARQTGGHATPTWSGHAHTGERRLVDMQLASGPGEGEDEGLLAFAQILTRRVSWGWEASTRRKKLPKRPKVEVMVRRPLEAFSAQKRDRQPGTTPDEAGSRPGGQGTAVRAQAAPHPVSACQASDPVSRCSVPPGRAQMIPAQGNRHSSAVA